MTSRWFHSSGKNKDGAIISKQKGSKLLMKEANNYQPLTVLLVKEAAIIIILVKIRNNSKKEKLNCHSSIKILSRHMINNYLFLLLLQQQKYLITTSTITTAFIMTILLVLSNNSMNPPSHHHNLHNYSASTIFAAVSACAASLVTAHCFACVAFKQVRIARMSSKVSPLTCTC